MNMKQYKDGKKVQNWHKPLGESELKHHYKQIMHKDPDFSNICETLLKADPYYEELLMDFRVTCSNDRHVGAGCQCDECIQLLDEDDLIAGKFNKNRPKVREYEGRDTSRNVGNEIIYIFL